MSYSETVSIVCAAVAGIVLLVVIGVRVRQSLLRRRVSPDFEASEVSQEVVPAAIPAAGQAPKSVQEPQAMVVEAGAIPELNPDPAMNSEPITSQTIVARLRELPPVQAEIEKDKYRGAKVEWTLYFSSLMLKSQNQIEVSLLNADNAYPGVSFMVDINQYPELMTIKWGMPVVVRGEISSVYSMNIILTGVDLSFHDPSSG